LNPGVQIQLQPLAHSSRVLALAVVVVVVLQSQVVDVGSTVVDVLLEVEVVVEHSGFSEVSPLLQMVKVHSPSVLPQ